MDNDNSPLRILVHRTGRSDLHRTPSGASQVRAILPVFAFLIFECGADPVHSRGPLFERAAAPAVARCPVCTLPLGTCAHAAGQLPRPAGAANETAAAGGGGGDVSPRLRRLEEDARTGMASLDLQDPAADVPPLVAAAAAAAAETSAGADSDDKKNKNKMTKKKRRSNSGSGWKRGFLG